MSNARAVRTSDTSTSTAPPVIEPAPAQGASFADGQRGNAPGSNSPAAQSTPQSTYAQQNPTTSPAKLSTGTGDLSLKGKGGTKDWQGNPEKTVAGATTVNAKAKKAEGTLTYSADGNAATAGGAVDLRDDGSLESAGVKGSFTQGGTGGGGGASVKMDEQGRVQGFGADAKVQGGGGSAAAAVAMGRSTSAPRAVDGRFEVDWDYDASVSASGGAMKGAFGGSAGGGFSGNRGGTQVFATEAEALEFRARFSQADEAFIASLVDVDALGDGESVGDSSKVSANIAVSAKAGQFTGGASVAAESGSGWTVKREGGSYLLVVKKDTSLKSAFSGSVLGLIKLSMGDTNRSADSFAVRFNGKDRADSIALHRWLNEGVVSGGELLWMETGVGHDDASGVGILGIRYQFVGTTGTKLVSYADGTKVETQVGQSNEGVSVPLVGKHDESHTMTATTDASGTSYGLRTEVQSDSATAAQRAMAQASGGNQWGAWGDAESSGQWSVTSEFSESQIGEFVAWARSGRAQARLDMVGAGWLVARLSGAGSDPDAQRAALTEFVADTGGKGLAVIHEQISGQTQSFPELAGDNTFLGKGGWAALETKASQFESQQGEAAIAARVASEAAAIAVECDTRIAVLKDRSNYEDLAANLRSQEIDRNTGMKFRMQKVSGAAKALAQETLLSKVDATAQVGTAPPADAKVAGTSKPTPSQAAASVDTELGMLQAEVDDLYAAMQADQRAALAAKRLYDRSVHEHTHHTGGRQVSPKDALGTRGMLSDWGLGFGDGLFVNDYEAAEKLGEQGVALLSRANVSLADVAAGEGEYMEALANPAQAMPAIKATMSKIRSAGRSFQHAADRLGRADEAYRQIARDSGDRFPWRGSYP